MDTNKQGMINYSNVVIVNRDKPYTAPSNGLFIMRIGQSDHSHVTVMIDGHTYVDAVVAGSYLNAYFFASYPLQSGQAAYFNGDTNSYGWFFPYSS